MKVFLFDNPETHESLLPLSFTRPISLFRCGILTIKEKWETILQTPCGIITVGYLQEKYNSPIHANEKALFINSSLLPDSETTTALLSLGNNEKWTHNGTLIAIKSTFSDFNAPKNDSCICKTITHQPVLLQNTFDIFLQNTSQIISDFKLLTNGRNSLPLSSSNTIIGPLYAHDGQPLVFIEPGATVEYTSINTTSGPIYIGKNAEIMEGSHLRGPLAICNGSKIKMGSKIYSGSTFGPFCKVGGEIEASVFFGFSNKAHDGFLGNAVIGEWCNIGAGVNASNLKNDYTKIRVWNYRSRSFMRTDLQFCGPIIGDHTKIGVNCMLNTATVLGVGVNIHGAGFPRVFIPSFSEGTASTGFSDVPMKKFFEIAERAMERRGIPFTESDKKIFEKIRQVADSLK